MMIVLYIKKRNSRGANRRKIVGKRVMHRARRMPIFTFDTSDSLRLTDYVFLTSDLQT